MNVVGEGGSGGALALGVGDHISMLEHSTYSVASPEACASIVWRDSTKADLAAEAMKLDAESVYDLGLIDEVIPELWVVHIEVLTRHHRIYIKF